MYWEVMGPGRGPFDLMSTTEGLLERKSSGSRSRKTEITAAGIRRADYATPLYRQKLALTSPTSGGQSVGIVRSRTQGTEFVLFVFLIGPQPFCKKAVNP
jgi:hypothetical protein